MLHQNRNVRPWVALATALSLILTPAAPLLSVPAQTPAVLKQTESGAPDESAWPKWFETSTGGTVVMYAPQVDSWTEQKQMVFRAAVSYTYEGSQKPDLGTVKVDSNTKVNLGERLVNFSDLTVTEASFPTLARDKVREITTELQNQMPVEERILSLDRVLEGVDKSQIMPKNLEGVKADPPQIFSNTTPAVLVGFDGEPIWSPIKDVDLRFAVNTNWDVFEHTPTEAFYFRRDANWLQASDVKGPWTPAGKLPESFHKLPADDNWKEVKANVPGKSLSAKDMPTVYVSFEPAELILMSGPPKYEPVEGTALLWVSNTESDLFRLGETGAFFYLVAGRWFSSATLEGPWTFASPNLPEDFKRIPVEHERSRVLASVPGSDQAAEAILLAQVPQVARVNPKEMKAPEVAYQGDPNFQPIEQTSLERAVNTDKDVIKYGDIYYLCFQGVWFISRSPTGPWEVASTIPQEVYQIPASSPSHHVTYVTVVEDDDDDDWVTFAYVAGYTGLMIAWGCAVWGTGWYYPPYVGWGYYPIYYPYPRTYGFSAWYNPWTGTYGRGAAVYGPYGGAGVGARYNPRTGTYARGAAAYGPYGAGGAARAWNPRTGTYAQTRQGSNVYGSWGSSYVQRGDDWVQTSRASNRATGTTTRATRTDQGAAVSRRGSGQSGFVARGEGGDVYAGRDGNVYRREGGQWQKHGEGGWSNVQPPEGAGDRAAQASERANQVRTQAQQVDRSTYGQLNRDSTARAQGAQRSRDYSAWRSGGSTRSGAGSYRFRGGGRRGGRRR
jgi:hypothetical protein